MCGLAGFFSQQGCAAEPAGALLEAMAAQLRHRGPDDGGHWCDPEAGVGLAHRRLAILDLSAAGHQPMASACGRLLLAFNGEIYNHRELRQQLEQAGQAPAWRGHSDTETLLAAIAAWGLAVTLPRLVGMFALALWDRQRRSLALARDRFGEKPLYLALARSADRQPLLLFGSELPALMVHPGYDRTIDRRATALYLRHAYLPAPWSIHAATRKLRPGCWLELQAADLASGDLAAITRREQPYWSAFAAARQALQQPFAGSPQEATTAVQAALARAVQRQSLADVPLGAFLSGGIDSSLVVAELQAQSSQPVRTFSIGFDDPQFNEAPYAAAVARHLGTDHSELVVSAADALAVIPELPAIYGEPFADSSQIPTALVARLARQQVRVALSGDAGDELFGGYNRYAIAPGLWRRLAPWPRPLRQGVAQLVQRLPARHWQRLLEPINRLLPASRRQRALGEKLHKLAGLLPPGSAAELYLQLVSQWSDTSGLVLAAHEHPPLVLDPGLWLADAGLEQQMMLLDTLTYLPDDILVKVDRAAMAVGLETRIPMLDPDLFDLAWSLPLPFKLAGGRGKLPLRSLLERHLPRELIARPKMGFGVPLASWLRGPLRDWGAALLDPALLRQQGLLDAEAVQACWQTHQQGGRERHYQLWPLLMLQAWLEHSARQPVLPVGV
ncbi:MAG: asparagine synthase (glutamine-hydrolyzing) [Cyanobacteriota bacterium]|nr:asparagine synthase (glutamine-hydrolyzing) [Cyanobacteriota bacterium]